MKNFVFYQEYKTKYIQNGVRTIRSWTIGHRTIWYEDNSVPNLLAPENSVARMNYILIFDLFDHLFYSK